MKLKSILAAAALMSVAPIASAQMSNTDVVTMAKAGLSDDVILSAIGGSPSTSFDTSANGLVALKEAGVSDKVIQAMIVGVQPSATASVKPAMSGMNPETVIGTTPEGAQNLRYLTPTTRMQSRPFAGVRQYAVILGGQSKTRFSSIPSFTIAVPENAQEDAYVTLAHLATRENDTREVLIGGGYASFSTGIHPDRIMPITMTLSPDQSQAPAGFRIFTATVDTTLEPGEYAIVLKAGLATSAGIFGAGTTDSYFDFGLD
ncbi:MAG: hypothetical protein CMK07_01625 [Ponticaulis sp.]|nr:hypothetical protein [Ponticaulis sp.]